MVTEVLAYWFVSSFYAVWQITFYNTIQDQEKTHGEKGKKNGSRNRRCNASFGCIIAVAGGNAFTRSTSFGEWEQYVISKR
ncbi:hypothetical protein L248_0370 [Schleiferilactobacillus shenzhenensis LY-73]|uniref:Uncharacterized protein n=1 Tax=Schleiferilactobacillus shenzhenensis LY-73 TaxID=1231336 RepID=U4TP68_9LACO|nr:hypothetical protein L248_0370 [Schleiferilactobacillus shenzhenensis LY-73]